MASPLRHLGELAKARATRRSSERADGQALGELEARPLALPAGLEVEWLGVSGYRMTYESRTLFIDPYLSRVPTHYDNFFRPLGKPLEFVTDVQLSELPDEIGAVSRDIRDRGAPPRGCRH